MNEALELIDKIETTMWSITLEEQTVNMIRNQAEEIVRLKESVAHYKAGIPVVTMRSYECKTVEDWQQMSQYYESQWSRCSTSFNSVAGKLRSEIERLHDELKQMECDDVGILRTENQNLKEVLSMQQSTGAELLDLRADNQKLRDALLNVARKAESLKRECGDDPESPQAIRNGMYMHLSYVARAALEGIK